MRDFETYTKREQAMVVVPDDVLPSRDSQAWAFLVELAETDGWMPNTTDFDPTSLWREQLLLRYKQDGTAYYRIDPRLRQLVLHIEAQADNE